MIQCQNCGQVNAQASNFCRFCGTKFLYNQMSSSINFEQTPPRPYSWKTDEFQVAEQPRPKTRQINQVQPLGRQNPPFTAQPPQPLVYQKPQSVAYNPHCPRCASQLFRYERKVSNAGWIVFAVLLITFFPLFWIGFLLKEDVRVCQVCNYRLG
ncbi:MAG: hypothetical protein M3033_18005 [Acidobacteriota bacterium]|nr:hypothetical protein [Acidobacteriota bacterium]